MSEGVSEVRFKIEKRKDRVDVIGVVFVGLDAINLIDQRRFISIHKLRTAC